MKSYFTVSDIPSVKNAFPVTETKSLKLALLLPSKDKISKRHAPLHPLKMTLAPRIRINLHVPDYTKYSLYRHYKKHLYKKAPMKPAFGVLKYKTNKIKTKQG